MGTRIYADCITLLIFVFLLFDKTSFSNFKINSFSLMLLCELHVITFCRGKNRWAKVNRSVYILF